MEGLTWLDVSGFRILRADYGVAKDSVQLMHAVKQEQYLSGPCVYSLTDFGMKSFSEAFVKEYGKTSRDLVAQKKIVAAYIHLIPELFDAAKEIIYSLRGETAKVEFFQTEPAALDWLMSFKDCE